MINKTFLLFLLLFVSLGCGVLSQPVPMETVISPSETAAPIPSPNSRSGAEALPLSVLQNIVYRSKDWGEYQLQDGVYYRTPTDRQAQSEAFTTRLMDPVLYGDLDQDGVEDAVVFLNTQNGGTGHFVEMAAVHDQNGTPVNVSTVYLGDRVIIESGAIKEGIVTLNMVIAGPDDPLCCPATRVIWEFKLEAGQWVPLQ